MSKVALKVKRLSPHAELPKYETAGAACFDLKAFINPQNEDEQIHVTRGVGRVVRTALAFEIPTGYVMLIFSRSGHGFKNDIRLSNCVGVIDSDYRGEVQVKIHADGFEGATFTVHHGDRIAQAMLVPIPGVGLIEADSLSDTERGASGLGSTGA